MSNGWANSQPKNAAATKKLAEFGVNSSLSISLSPSRADRQRYR